MSKDELTLFTQGKLFKQYVSLQKDLRQLDTKLSEQWDSLKKAMEENDATNISGDWGTITLSTRKNYKEAGVVSDEFKKSVLDTTKVGAQVTLTGELPDGVEVSETKYLTKKFK